jgi:hypothetical protein
MMSRMAAGWLENTDYRPHGIRSAKNVSNNLLSYSCLVVLEIA